MSAEKWFHISSQASGGPEATLSDCGLVAFCCAVLHFYDDYKFIGSWKHLISELVRQLQKFRISTNQLDFRDLQGNLCSFHDVFIQSAGPCRNFGRTDRRHRRGTTPASVGWGLGDHGLPGGGATAVAKNCDLKDESSSDETWQTG